MVLFLVAVKVCERFGVKFSLPSRQTIKVASFTGPAVSDPLIEKMSGSEFAPPEHSVAVFPKVATFDEVQFFEKQ